MGTYSVLLVDVQRNEPFARDKKQNREIMVNVWYPAQPTQEETVYYTTDYKHLVALNEDIEPEAVAHVDSIKTYAHHEAPFADAQQAYPGLIFSPGSSSPAATYETICEDLASHGYIVFGLNHPYQCAHLTLPDGRVITADPLFTDRKRPLADWIPLLDRELETWVSDIQYLMHWLQNGNSKHLDTTRIGMLGHSYGGAAVTQAGRWSSSQVKGIVNIDGPLFGTELVDPYKVPYMFLGVERSKNQWFTQQLAAVDELIKNSDADTYYIQLKNADHNSFREYNLLRNVHQPDKIDSLHAIAITRQVIRGFFDVYIKNQSQQSFNAALDAISEIIVE